MADITHRAAHDLRTNLTNLANRLVSTIVAEFEVQETENHITITIDKRKMDDKICELLSSQE